VACVCSVGSVSDACDQCTGAVPIVQHCLRAPQIRVNSSHFLLSYRAFSCAYVSTLGVHREWWGGRPRPRNSSQGVETLQIPPPVTLSLQLAWIPRPRPVSPPSQPFPPKLGGGHKGASWCWESHSGWIYARVIPHRASSVGVCAECVFICATRPPRMVCQGTRRSNSSDI